MLGSAQLELGHVVLALLNDDLLDSGNCAEVLRVIGGLCLVALRTSGKHDSGELL